MKVAAFRPMPDSSTSPGERPAAAGHDPSAAPTRSRGWPLWLRVALAVVVLSFVWSPFLAMLARLSRISPSLQPTGGTPDLIPPPTAPQSPPGRNLPPASPAAAP